MTMIWRCPKCGYKTGTAVKFCGLDGTRMEEKQVDIACPSCGRARVFVGDKFCEECGTPYDGERAVGREV